MIIEDEVIVDITLKAAHHVHLGKHLIIGQDGCEGVFIGKQQATQLIEVLTKWVAGGEVE